MKKLIYIILTIAFVFSFTSCNKDSLDPTLGQDKAIETSINTEEDVFAILMSIYNHLTHTEYYGRNAIIYGVVRTDDTFSNGTSGRFITESTMNYTPESGYPNSTWTRIYRTIASANIIIGLDPLAITGDQDVIEHYQGQAYAIRALAHYDLLRFFGQQHVTNGGNVGIPYVKTYKGDQASLFPSRNTVAECKQFILEDLTTASSLMSETLNDGSKQYITTHAVNAITARVALYFGEWQTAADKALAVINSGEYSIIPAESFVDFWSTDGGVNSIFELAFSSTDNQNISGLAYMYRGTSYGDVEVAPLFLDIFDDNDIRASAEMIGPESATDARIRNHGKYPSADYSDNVPLIRYEEVILIYAEALFELNPADPDVLTYLNMVPAKRDANLYTTASIDNILLERRKELCFEGFRFDDLARRGLDIPATGSLQNPHGLVSYGDRRYAFAIPREEMDSNSNMTQNYGY